MVQPDRASIMGALVATMEVVSERHRVSTRVLHRMSLGSRLPRAVLSRLQILEESEIL